MKFEDQKYYNCSIKLDDGKIFNVNANWIHNQQLDFWQGWDCNAGVDRLFVSADFTVFGGECTNDNLGNLLTDWQLLSKPTTCTQPRCSGCTDDILTFKKENNNDN